MSEMRKLINLFEAVTLPSDDPDTTVDTDAEGDGERLDGVGIISKSFIDTNFPSVSQTQLFYSGWLKIVANKEEDLTQFELWELGRAFVDVIRMDEHAKMRLFRKLILIRMAPGGEDEPTHIMNK